jgi:signal transduction histidine kinase
LWILADGDRLTQILTNLVHNAIKFTPPGGSILITTARTGENSVMMSVSDTGPGIPEEAIPKLFDPFYQAHRQQEIGTKGLGLGLAIVKNLVDLHGGAIAVECGKEQGTTFKVTLRIKPKQPTQA